MKRAKRIYALLGVLAVASVATVLVLNHQEQQEQIRNSGEVVLEVEPDSVQSLSWEYESETLAFHKEDGWLYDDDTAFPVDEEKINELLEQFQEFSAAFIIEEVTDYSQYGLDDPVCTIQLSTDEQNYEIKLGNCSAMDSQRYVSIGDGNVYLAVSDPLDYFDAQLSDVILNDETPDFDTVESIQFQGEDSYQVTYVVHKDSSGMGYLEGTLTQTGAIGHQCTSVKAVANPGYVFDSWGCTVGRINDVKNPVLQFYIPGNVTEEGVQVFAKFKRAACTCTTKCDSAAGTVNQNCPVCKADPSQCKGTTASSSTPSGSGTTPHLGQCTTGIGSPQ